jgi:hypothetical protein
MSITIPSIQDVKNTLAFTGFGFCAVKLGQALIGYAGALYEPATNLLTNSFRLNDTGKLLFSTHYIFPVMLASSFMKLVDPKKPNTQYDVEAPIRLGNSMIQPNFIGHLMNNSARGLLDYSVAAIVISHTHNLLKSQSFLASHQWLSWGIAIGLGGTAAKLFDSKAYKPYCEKRVAFITHKIGAYYEDASNTVHTFIGM